MCRFSLGVWCVGELRPIQSLVVRYKRKYPSQTFYSEKSGVYTRSGGVSTFTRYVVCEFRPRLSIRRHIHDHLGGLALLWILNHQSRNEGRAGDQYYEYEFTVGLTLVYEVVDTLDGVSLPRCIRHQLSESLCCDQEHSIRWGVSVRSYMLIKSTYVF